MELLPLLVGPLGGYVILAMSILGHNGLVSLIWNCKYNLIYKKMEFQIKFILFKLLYFLAIFWNLVLGFNKLSCTTQTIESFNGAHSLSIL